MIKDFRFQRQNVCRECASLGLNCSTGKKCEVIRKPLRHYDGLRITADGFDCALPVTIDSHSSCAYECLYCFSDNILGHNARRKLVGQTPLSMLEGIFSGGGGKRGELFRKALKYDRRNAAGFPSPVQLGGLSDSFDSIEENQGWAIKFMELAIKYNQPVRISTKGVLFLIDEYLNVMKKAPHLFWVAFSIISDDDELMKRVDRFAPSPSLRLKAMKRLTSIGVKTSLRLRPIIKGISDRNCAYKTLIAKSADAGAGAVSYEVAFYPAAIGKENVWKWKQLDEITGINMRRQYEAFGKIMACSRPSYLWTENIMHSIKETAHKYGMVAGVSDPVWKQLTDVGCCCGIKPDDKVFGNWERENATNMMLLAKQGKKKIIRLKDITPPWAYEAKAAGIINPGAGPKTMWNQKHLTWAMVLKKNWNNRAAQRSPENYFQGAWKAVGKDDEGNLTYKYVGLKRHYKNARWGICD